MNTQLLKSIAFQAKRRLASENLPVGSSKIHQLIAALHGFNSKAAMLAFVTDHPSLSSTPVLVRLNPALAKSRCVEICEGIDPDRVVAVLCEAFEASRHPTSRYVLNDMETPSTRYLIRALVHAEPRMGPMDDLDPDYVLGEWEIRPMVGLTIEISTPATMSIVLFPGSGSASAVGYYRDKDGVSGGYELGAVIHEHRSGLYGLESSTVSFSPTEMTDEDDLMEEFYVPLND